MKRRTIKLLLFLLLGAIINVAVAWLLGAIFYDGSRTDCILESKSNEPSDLAHIAICSAETWSAIRLDCFKDFDSSGSWRWVADLSEQVPCWAQRWINRHEMEGHAERHFAVYASGWPLRSMSGRVRISPTMGNYTLQRDSVIVLPPPKPMRNDQSRLLPFAPIFPGFAINTIFYAAILWGTFALPFAIRRRRRIKRGVCVRCAYPVGTSTTCSECGAMVKPTP